MKKRIFLMLVMTVMLVLALSIAVSADSVHAGKVDLNATVEVDGQQVALFDAEGNALIWYKDASGALKSIRADIGIEGTDKVDFQINNWQGVINGAQANQFDKIVITVGGETYDAKSIVVFNIMDDDVVITTSTKGGVGNPVNCFENVFKDASNLQYAFVRLDTVAFQKECFKNASNLKYVNFEDLYQLTQIIGNAFQDCKSLGPDLILRNSVINVNTAAFRNCQSLKTVSLGASVNTLGSWDAFMDCKNLEIMYIPGTLTNVPINTFKNTTNIKMIGYVGTKDQASTFISKAASSGGNPVIAELTLISYSEYKALENKDGKYFIYDYNYCIAFNDGVHTLDPEKSNPCAGICGTCGEASLAANPVHNYVTTIVYENYLAKGVKTQTCQNEGCAHKATPVVSEAAALVSSFKGVSVKEDASALTFGYTLDLDAVKEFEEANGTKVEFGFVVAVKALLGENAPLKDDGAAATDKVVKASVANDEYTAADFVLRGTWEGNVTINEAEIDIKKVEFYMAGYIIVNGAVSYLNYGASGANAGTVTFEQASTVA